MYSTLHWGRALLSFLLVHALYSKAQAQLPEVLQSLDLSSLHTEYLWTGSLPEKLPPLAVENALVEHQEAEQMMLNMRKSHIAGMESYESLLHRRRTIAEETRAIPISVLEIQFNHFLENTLENGWIVLQDGRLSDAANRSVEPYGSSETLVFSIDAKEVNTGAIKFVWEPSLFHHNYGVYPDVVRIDFADGYGWRELSNEQQVLDVHFDDQVAQREVKFEILRNGQWKRTRTLLQSVACASGFPLPGTPPWPIASQELPWEIQVNDVRGNAYTLLSEDGVFDKPFIFVEGIDFGYQQLYLRNGDFGWCEFAGGSPDTYAMLEDMPLLLYELRQRNYDIVLLDFSDGARRIEENTELLIHLIRLCIHYRQGDEPLVIAGASMGGQITRHALTTMEQNREDHCTRLWISLDSPHEGAYVPASLQGAIQVMAPFNASASEMLNHKLLRPAARQMLKFQLFDDPNTNTLFSPDYEAWQATKEVMGYPQKCVKVALANGAGAGAGLGYPLSEMLVDYECTFIPPNEDVQFHLYPLPGKSNHPMSTASDWVVTDVVYTESLGLFNSGITGINQYHLYALASSEWPRWDYAPGGTRTSISEFVEAFNDTDGLDDYCSLIQPDQYNARHCFIPTSSALGIKNENPFLPVTAHLQQYPAECPFDFYWIPSHHERHSEVTEESIAWLGTHLFSNEDESGQPLLPELLAGTTANGATFNFSRPELATIGSMTIENGGRIHVNGWMRSHYGTPNDPFPTFGSHFVLSTLPSCNGAEVVVGNNGRLTVGNTSEITTGTFLVENGGIVRVKNGGKLWVHPGSRMIVREGGVLVLEEGSELIINQSIIELGVGGEIHYNGGIFILEGVSSRMVFSGGKMHIAQGVAFHPFRSDAEGGFFDVRSFSESDILLHEGAALTLEGQGEDDLLVFIPNAYHLGIEGLGTAHIDVKNGLLDFSNGGVLAHSCHLSVVKCKVQSLQNNANSLARISCWGATTSVQHSVFDQASIECLETKLSMLRTEMNGKLSGVVLNGGSYWVEACSFVTSGIRSVQLSGPGRVNFTSFSNVHLGSFAIADKSEQTIDVFKCWFERYPVACSKTQGKLIAKCCEWSRNQLCFFIGHDAYLGLGATDGAGRNVFDVNASLAQFQNARVPNFMGGLNDFSGGFEQLFTGTIQLEGCSASCNAVPYYANGNIWSTTAQVGPNESLISLFTSQSCSSGSGCGIKVFDQSPILETGCSGTDEYYSFKDRDVESTAALGSEESKPTAVLFPNPTSAHATLICRGWEGPASIVVFSAEGKQMWSIDTSFNVVEERITIPCVGWAAGIYHVSIVGERANESLRLLVD